MRFNDLPVFVLQQVGAIAVQHTRAAADQRRSVPAGIDAVAGGFNADQLHGFIVDIRVKDAHRVRSAAHARDHRIRLTANQLGHLHLAFVADHALEIADHHRVRVRTGHRAEDVEGAVDVRDPIAHRFVQRVLQGPRAGFDRNHPGAEKLHPIDVLRLALDVLRAHVDDAFHAVARGDGRGGNAVHAGAGLGNDFGNHARLAHAFREQRLADHVVHLVGARVVQVFALQEYLRAAEQFAPALRVVNRGGTTDKILQLALIFRDEVVILLIFLIGFAQFIQCMNQRFGDEHAAILAEMASFVGQVIHCVILPSVQRGSWPNLECCLNHPASAWRTARTNAAIRAWSFTPFAPCTSMPLETSTAYGRTR